MRWMATTASLALFAATAQAGEGKWTPQQVLQLGPDWLKAQGFSLPLARLWDEKTGSGLLANAVQLPGCSGSFVSAEGLLMTNHHCVVGILQQHSTPQANLGRDGFLARSREDEKPAQAYRIQVPRGFRDVTEEVRSRMAVAPDDLTRFRALEAAEKALVAACESRPATRCQFAAFDGGLFFTLTEFEELTDVRLVYAPPEMVGNFGGEVDNWSWPRHSGDFALLRAYRDGRPYAPKHVFAVSADGVRPGDAVAVLGYPGRSYRGWIAEEMAERESRWFPALREVLAEWIALLQKAGREGAAVAIAVEADLRSFENGRKNAEGQIAGLRRGRIVERQRLTERAVGQWAADRPDQKAALDAYGRLQELNAARLASWERDFLLDLLARGPRALRWPAGLARRSMEAVKPDAERSPGYLERDLPRLREAVERDQQRYVETADKALTLSWLRRALALPEGQRIGAIDAAFGGQSEGERAARLDAMYAASRIFDLPTRLGMFDEAPETLRSRRDPLLELGFALEAERLALERRRDQTGGATLLLRPAWRRAVIAHAGRPQAPDANGSLRVSFGRVAGYSPREAVEMTPQTTLAGMIAKHTGEDPFDVPERVRRAFADGRVGRWRDAALGQVPVGFLATCDTTGGNSGSPVIDGRGRLVGINFDRVWENVANDFGYDPEVARNVSVDIRYLLWLLEEIEDAPELVREMGVPDRVRAP